MKRNRVLIVDDKEENLYLLRTLLQGNGYEVVAAIHGAEALEKARQNPPDLVVADILMPVMDGFSLCREWKSDKELKHIPFVFYTATYTDERDREFALSLGAERFIVKPQEPDVFMELVRETIKQVKSPHAKQTGAAAKTPARLSVEAPEEKKAVYLKQYNEALIRKLEAKMEQLEKANRELERDITERKRTEEALRESEERYRALFEGAIEGVAVADIETRKIWYANPAMCKMFGYSKEELSRLHVDDLHPQEARQRVLDEFKAQVQGDKILSADVPCVRKDGPIFYADINAKSLVLAGRPVIVGFFNDITERKQAEAKMAAQLDELRRWQTLMMERSDRSQELKREVNELLNRLGEPIRYPSQAAKVSEPPPSASPGNSKQET